MRKVNVLIYRGTGERSKYLYAHVTDADTGDLILATQATYAAEAIKDRGYQVVNLEVKE